MTFTIPNEADATHKSQAGLFAADIAIIAAGIAGDGVVSGVGVIQSANGPGMDVDIPAGSVRIGGTVYAVAQQLDKAIGAGDATYPRIDLIEVGTDGTVDVTAGTAAASPVPPSPQANHVALAFVFVDSSEAASIVTADITDKGVALAATPWEMVIAAGDETTAISTGIKAAVHAPADLTLTGIRGTLTTANTAQSIVDVHVEGVTIMTTDKIEIDATEDDSDDATTPPVLTTTAVSKGDKIEVEVDTAGAAGAGLKVTLIGERH